MASVISCVVFHPPHKARPRDWGLNMQREKQRKARVLIPQPTRLWMRANQLHPDDSCVSVNLCMRIQKVSRLKSISSLLSAEQTTTTLKCICPFRKPRSVKTDVSERGRHIIRPLQQRETPQSEAIKNQQKETETIDQPGWSLPLCVHMSQKAQRQMRLSEQETDCSVHHSRRL